MKIKKDLPLQYGRGANEPSRIDIFHQGSHHYRRFNTEGREIRVRIRVPPENEEPYQWLSDAVQQIYQHLIEGRNGDDLIGLSVHSDYFTQGDLWLSFRPIRQFEPEDFWDIFYSAVRSQTEFIIDQSLVITVALVRPPAGTGRKKLTHEDVQKKSILTVTNDDNLCLPRSLVLSLAHNIRGQQREGEHHDYWLKICRRNRREQKIQAQKLVDRAGVVIPRDGCGLGEIHKFQVFFAPQQVAITIFNFQTFGRGGAPLYDGTAFVKNLGFDIIYTLRIMFFETARHFRPILNLTAAAGSRGYCEQCNIAYMRVIDHRCTFKCCKCLQKSDCDSLSELIDCQVCGRDFFGNRCFENHKKIGSFDKSGSVCQKIIHCKKCFKVVREHKERHVCNTSRCRGCGEKKPLNHLCFMRPIREKICQSGARILFVFFDLESQQSLSLAGNETVKVHVPNLCVVQQSCSVCMDNNDLSANCTTCGQREYIFQDDPIRQLMNYLLSKENFSRVIVLSHGGSFYDLQFIVKHLVERTEYRDKPRLILNGTKIIMMTFTNLKFLDSYNYFHLPLRSLPKAYGIENIEKGVFPHKFNTPENQDYEGEIPEIEYYGIDEMRAKEREELMAWHTKKRAENYVFRFQDELIRYCRDDVNILRLACSIFRKNFFNMCSVCPFDKACTIASTCLYVLRKNFLKHNTIGIIPPGGYRLTERQSAKAIYWLTWMERVLGREIQFSARGKERQITGNIRVDGFCAARNPEEKSICLNFHGCYWHGCPKHFPLNRDKVFRNTNESLDDRLERTRRVSQKIKSLGYHLIEKWECDFDQEMAENPELSEFLSKNNLLKIKPLDPRDAFYGGRTGNTAINVTGKMGYVDIRSLYPFVCKYGKYPIGHPKVYVGRECAALTGPENDISKVEGLISCDILPPRNLYHPVLPVKCHHKLLFPLCRACCDEMKQEDCDHEDQEQRIFTGSWVVDEVRKAIEFGYKITQVHEIWQYEITQYNKVTQQGGLFHEYIDQFFKEKVKCSGFPADCLTEDDKEAFVQRLRADEGIDLRVDEICDNAGARSVAKLCCNSLWGKMAQRENMGTTEIITDPEKFFNLLADPEVEVTAFLPVNDDTLYVRWCCKDEAVQCSSNTNVVVAAYTTAQARIILHSYLTPLGERAKYFDTDSVIFVREPGVYEPRLGPLLGDMVDELEMYGPGSYISELISGGPKFYAYEVVKPNGEKVYVIKIKGLTLTYRTTSLLNFQTLRELVTGRSEHVTVTSENIRRTVFHDVVTRTEKKVCRPVLLKRRFVGLEKSYPYGYKRDGSATSSLLAPENAQH